MEWISVEERLPELCKDVLIYDEFGIGGGAVYPHSGWVEWDGKENETVTHWMPLPDPPTDSKQGETPKDQSR